MFINIRSTIILRMILVYQTRKSSLVPAGFLTVQFLLKLDGVGPVDNRTFTD